MTIGLIYRAHPSRAMLVRRIVWEASRIEFQILVGRIQEEG